jgi:hypothetical protein
VVNPKSVLWGTYCYIGHTILDKIVMLGKNTLEEHFGNMDEH